MDMLKKLFPHAFAATEQNKLVTALIVYIVVAVVGALVGWLVGTLLGWIPVVGFIIGLVLKIVGTVVDVYAIGGVILTLLVYFKVIK